MERITPPQAGPALRLLRTEEVATDEAGTVPRRAPFAMMAHEVYDTYAHQCGPIAWAVFTALQRHADTSGYCFPSQATIATGIGASRRSVTTAIAKLVDLGMVKVENRATKSHAKTSNGYKILVGMHAQEVRIPIRKIRATHTQEVRIPHAGGAHEEDVLNNNQLTTPPPTPIRDMNGAAPDALESGGLEKTLGDENIARATSKFLEVDELFDEHWLRRVLRQLSVPAMGPQEVMNHLKAAHKQILLRFEASKTKDAKPIHSPRKFAERIVLSEFGGTS